MYQKELNGLTGQISPTAHSSWAAFRDGKLVSHSPQSVCYSMLWELKQADKLFVRFGVETQKNNPTNWANWIINESFYAPAFITKDAEEGMNGWFEVDTNCELFLMQGGMIALRHPFEFQQWSWNAFRERGFDEYDSYTLASHFIVYGKKLFDSTFNTNHLVIQKNENRGLYRGDGYTPSNTTFAEGGLEKCMSLTREGFGCNCKHNWDGIKSTAFTKENCEKFLKHLENY